MTTRDILAQTFTIISGDEIHMVVKKATTRLNFPPKRKHVDTLVQYVQNPRANLVHLIDCLSRRIRKNHWMVTAKALLTTHNLMNRVNKVLMPIISRRQLFEISGWIDNSNAFSVQMSPRVTQYAKYLSLKIESYRVLSQDLTTSEPSDVHLSVSNIKNVFLQLEYLNKLSTLIDENQVDFSAGTTIFYAIHVMLLKEKFRIYSTINRIMIFLLEHLNDLEASDAVTVIPRYKDTIRCHQSLEKLVNLADSKGVEGIGDVKLATPMSEIIQCLEDLVRDIVAVRGTPLLQKEWNVNNRQLNETTIEKQKAIINLVGSTAPVIPTSVTQDSSQIFMVGSIDSLDLPFKTRSVEELKGPLFTQSLEFENIQEPYSCRQQSFKRCESEAFKTHQPHIEFTTATKQIPAISEKKESSDSLNEIDRLIHQNLKMTDNTYKSPKAPSVSSPRPNPFL